MLDNEFEISKLLVGHLKGELNPKEEKELKNWLTLSEENNALFEELNKGSEIANDLKEFQSVDQASVWNQITHKINSQSGIVKKNKFALLSKIAAAAVIAITLSIGIYIYPFSNQNISEATLSAQEIKPGKNSATLTLSNGLKLILSDEDEGQLAEETGVEITKTSDGQIIYNVLSANANSENTIPVLNTLATTNGQKFQVVLPDQSKVWLNSASSLKFPASFNGSSNRKVELIGEAYFEIVENKNQPFIVESRGQEVSVLGTHFNISAYTDETSSKTTLIEGSVKIDQIANQKSQILIPGQQAILGKNSFDVKTVVAESVVAWKNDYFFFENEELKEIMRELSRWYNIEVSYEGKYQPMHFSGSVASSKNLSEALRILELTGNVTYRVEEVSPSNTRKRIVIIQ